MHNLNNQEIIAGVDEAGRGPLAGPVIAAAVILPANFDLPGLTDSKKLSEKQRKILFEQIKNIAISISVGRAEVEEINQLNILHATMLAMQRALTGLKIMPTLALIDGNRCPQNTNCQTRAIIGGDLLEPTISAASIIAKVTRDQEMYELHEKFPQYGFNQHKGYGTKQHLTALKEHGASEIHRKFFAPVAACLL